MKMTVKMQVMTKNPLKMKLRMVSLIGVPFHVGGEFVGVLGEFRCKVGNRMDATGEVREVGGQSIAKPVNDLGFRLDFDEGISVFECHGGLFSFLGLLYFLLAYSLAKKEMRARRIISDSLTFLRWAFLSIFNLSSAGIRAITTSFFRVVFFMVGEVSFLWLVSVDFLSAYIIYHAPNSNTNGFRHFFADFFKISRF